MSQDREQPTPSWMLDSYNRWQAGGLLQSRREAFVAGAFEALDQVEAIAAEEINALSDDVHAEDIVAYLRGDIDAPEWWIAHHGGVPGVAR